MPIRALDRLTAAYRAFRDPDLAVAARGDDKPVPSLVLPEDPYDLYALLEFYKESRAYEAARLGLLENAMYPEDYSRILALENPALQAVQFGVMHLFPGRLEEAMPLVVGKGGNQALVDAGRTVLQWSNMAAQKDAVTEDVYTLGDVFLKQVVKPDRRQVYIENRHPGEVWAYREDNLRNIKWIRLDVPLEPEENDGDTMWTEIWDHDENLYVAWRHRQGRGTKPDELGTPYEGPMAITNLGHDYVPFVRVPFEAGARPNVRSPGVFERHLVPIDQSNRIATELDHLYRENAEGVWATMRGEPGKDPIELVDDDEAGEVESEEVAHGRRIVHLSGVAKMQDLVPDIDYQVGLNKIEDRRKALERSMAELRYFRGIEGGDPAAAAIRLDLAPAIARARFARGNAEDGILRCLKMCLSVGQKLRLFERGIGSFEAGNFDTLGFEDRPIMPESPSERAARETLEASALREIFDLGVPELIERALLEREFSEEDAKRIAADAVKRAERGRASRLVNDLGGLS